MKYKSILQHNNFCNIMRYGFLMSYLKKGFLYVNKMFDGGRRKRGNIKLLFARQVYNMILCGFLSQSGVINRN